MPPKDATDREYIAVRELIDVDKTGVEFRVRISLGVPQELGPDEWACAMALDGVQNVSRDIRGCDSFQSLMLAQNLAKTLLKYFVEDGGKLLDEPGGRTVDIEKLFATGIIS
jgi:hypothetical protein